MDSLLLAFIQSSEEVERERLLDEIIVNHACPHIRRTLMQRLGLRVSRTGSNPNNPSAEDIYQDVITKVIQWLNNLKIRPDQKAVRNFEQYVSRIAVNVCNDHLREKSPVRHRLKNSLRDLMESHSDFSIWRNHSHGFVAGFNSWRRAGDWPISERSARLEGDPDLFRRTAFVGRDVHRVPLVDLIAELFNWLGGPIVFESLVNIVAHFLEVKEQIVESLDDDQQYWDQCLIDSKPQPISRLETREAVRQLWNEVKRLPEKQREALYLSFEYEGGTDLFSLLVDSEVSTLAQIAKDLEMPLLNLLSLWKMLPMDNPAVAEYMNASREHVSKWRYRALKQLEKNLIGANSKK